jgi:cobalt-zinc-cadmium efflux system membrane fusion protein
VNDDHLAHVTPRVAGVVREVVVTLGDRVKKGQVLAVLESRELADAVSEWLAAHQRRALAERVASREERLFEQRVSAEQDYLDATTARAEAEIELR